MKQLLIFLLLILLSCACQKADVEIPDTGRKLVINGLITTDSLINVQITRSDYIRGIDTGSLSGLDGVDVRIYNNNTFLDSLHYWATNSYYYSRPYSLYPLSNFRSGSIYPIFGDEYKIIAKKQGYPDAMAKARIPRLVKIERVDTSRTLTSVYTQDFIMNCKIEFTDPAAEKNYYIINIVTNKLPFGKEYMAFDCNDPVIEEEFGSRSMQGKVLKFGYAFSDKLIDGKKYSLSISFDGFDYVDLPYNPMIPNSYTIYFRLYSISEDYFKFIHTMNLFNATYTDPFSEPVMVYSNVSGGYGIFSGAAVSTDSIIFHN